MKIHIISDLHLEFGNFPDINEWGGEVLCMCGDIVQISPLNPAHAEFLGNLFKKYQKVFWVWGNHEWYRSFKHPSAQSRIEATFHTFGFHHLKILDNAFEDMGGFRFIGSTLWTSFEGQDLEATQKNKQAAQECMADFSHIMLPDESPWTPDRCAMEHALSRQFIETALNTHLPCVVLTHHLPTYDLVPLRFLASELNPAFATNLEHLMGKNPLIWACGHVHNQKTVVINRTRCIVHAYGYPGEFPHQERYQPYEVNL